MNNEFVPYEIALALKELGFDESCFGYYLDKKLNIFHNTSVNDRINSKTIEIFSSGVITSPTFSQAFRWFREKCKLGAIVSQFGWGIEDEFGQILYNIGDDKNPLCYEESELECLKKLIEICQNK